MKNSALSSRPRYRRALWLLLALAPAAPVLAGLATLDTAGETRALPTVTMGALEEANQPASPPAVVRGIYLTAQRVAL